VSTETTRPERTVKDELAALLAQNPRPGDLFEGSGCALLAVADDNGQFAGFANADGGWLSPEGAVDGLGALTRLRVVPADAIVLERPTERVTLDLADEFPDGHLITLATKDGYVTVAEACEECEDSSPLILTPAAARMHAAYVALAADDAERHAP
jgi:hypothetical protein